MSGFFPIMMFGLPGAALAMYLAAPKARRPMVGGMLLSVAITAFLTGVTEPLEFLFMFLAPLLYLLHAVLTVSACSSQRRSGSMRASPSPQVQLTTC